MAKSGDARTVINLMLTGVDLKVVDEDGQTPLYWAIMNGHLDVVTALVKIGDDILNVECDKARTPILVAASYAKLNIVEYLLACGADLTAKDNNGKNALQMAHKMNDDKDVIRALEKEFQILAAKEKSTLKRLMSRVRMALHCY